MSTRTPDHVDTETIEYTRWRIDPACSSAEFRAQSLYRLQTVRGKFWRYDGRLSLGEKPAVQLTIDADSLDTRTPTVTSICVPPTSSTSRPTRASMKAAPFRKAARRR
jgi:polyisoprenoid-binding protein YceI